MSETIYDSDFTRCLPQPLTHDPKMIALAKAVTNELVAVSGEIKNVLIYSRIDDLPEWLVDILAYDFHIDWYDYSYSLDVKRNLVKNSVMVHKKMGTKYAVENVLRSLYPQSRIEEWFEYGGSPYCFRIIVNVDNRKCEIDINKIINSINMYKRLSAHLESIILGRKRTKKIFIMPIKEMVVRRKININPYNKTINTYLTNMVGNAALICVSLIVHKKG